MILPFPFPTALQKFVHGRVSAPWLSTNGTCPAFDRCRTVRQSVSSVLDGGGEAVGAAGVGNAPSEAADAEADPVMGTPGT
jgi:hypothetical protein